MIYNDTDFTKRGVEASILSIKNDINRRIGRVQLKYGEIYDAIVAESNGLVDFVNEFRAAVDIIVNECNDLQGLTDDELTEIKQRIEELKQILDSIEIPDLPKIKKSDEIFSEPSDGNDEPQDGCESGYCSIGVGAQVSGSSPLPGNNGGNNATTFGCYDYTVIYGEDGECNKNYVVWGNCNAGDGICIMNYDEALDTQCGLNYTGQYDGCLSKYEDENYKCDGDFMIHMCVNHDNGDSCGSGFMSSNTTCDYMYGESSGSFGQCESNYSTCEENVGDAPTKSCEESYFTTEGGITTCNGYSTQNENCPQSYQVAYGVSGCVADYRDSDNYCNSNYEKSDGSQSITTCSHGFNDGTINCGGGWSTSEVGNMDVCAYNFSANGVTCQKNYCTDGTHKYCDNNDAACGGCLRCVGCVSSNCTTCNNPGCYGTYCPSYTPEPCGEGGPPPCSDDVPCGQCPDYTPEQPCNICDGTTSYCISGDDCPPNA